MKPLPYELWFLIAALSRRKDLPSLARVSAFLLCASRPALYRHLSLQNSRCIEDTVSLLVEDPSVARKVERLELTSETPLNYSIWPPFEAMKGMKNLRSLCLRGDFPFKMVHEQNGFMVLLAEFCPLLKEIEIDLPANALFPGFGLRGIEKVKWRDSRRGLTTPFSDPASRSLLRASKSTITHISFPGKIDDFEAEWLISFSALRFPSLRSLAVGPWIDVNSPEIPTALTRFLLAHPTLVDVELGYCLDNEWHVDLDPNVIPSAREAAGTPTTAMLPALRRLHAHPYHIQVLARRAPDCLRSLIALEVGTGLEAYARDDLTNMLRDLRHTGEMPNLRRLSYFAGESTSDDLDGFGEWMEGFAAVCPGVEMWKGDLPSGMTLGILVQTFFKFANLREISLRTWVVPEPQDLAKLDAARALASQCPRLERFSSRRRFGGVTIIRIARDGEGRMTSTSLSEEDEDQDTYGYGV